MTYQNPAQKRVILHVPASAQVVEYAGTFMSPVNPLPADETVAHCLPHEEEEEEHDGGAEYLHVEEEESWQVQVRKCKCKCGSARCSSFPLQGMRRTKSCGLFE